MGFKFNKPTLITITGPSGSGKTTILNRLLSRDGSDAPVLVSTARAMTTRDIRPNEVQGREYDFVTREEFESELSSNNLIEYNAFLGNYYGVSKKEFLDKVYGVPPLCVIVDPNGVACYRKYCLENDIDMLRVFIRTPASVILERIMQRKQDELELINEELLSTPSSLTDEQWLEVSKTQHQKTKFIEATTNARITNYTLVESRWQNADWDVTIPGDDINRAIEDLHAAVVWHNKKNLQIGM